ncbi:hypothetical protein [Streptomyces katrae]|uniref:hypothetical protein n=1 Tax=Streptomyces katrae TaxID=68223 RepID=UPI0012FEAC1E|nr:hypothetical protein [Streptomyces katrae]
MAFVVTATVGCSGGRPEQQAPVPTVTRVSADQACAGLFPEDGRKALERVLESTEFQLLNQKWNPDARAVAQVMEDAYRSGKRINEMPQSTCEVAGSDKGHYVPTLSMQFTAYSLYAGDPVDFPGVSDRGVRVAVREQKFVHLSYDCVSPRVGSTADVPLRIKVLFHEQWPGSKGETILRPDYLAITHSAALAVAKELQCAGDGGLPARASDLPPG